MEGTTYSAFTAQQSQEYLSLEVAEVKIFVTLTLGGAEVGDIVFSYLSEKFPYCDYNKDNIVTKCRQPYHDEVPSLCMATVL